MIRSRVAPAATLLVLVWTALVVPALAQTSPAPSPSASGSIAPSVTAGGGAPSPSASTVAADSLRVLLSAQPGTMDLDEEGTIVAQVVNTGTTSVRGSLDVTLPAELAFVSAFPSATGGGGATHSFDLGDLDAGDSAVVQVVVRGTAAVPAALVTATARGGSAESRASLEVPVVVASGTDGLEVSSRSRRVLTQVGSMLHYEVTVANDGASDLENVFVVNVAPSEVDVFSVDIVDEVEAVQIGESGGRHDIVWNVGTLTAGESVTLPWDGHAARSGDLRAVNDVRGLLGSKETARARSESFLGASRPGGVSNPPFEPLKKRIVTFEDPPPPPRAAAAMTQTAPGVLPFTGTSPTRLVTSAFLFIAGGLLLLVGAHLAPAASRRAVAGAVLAGLVGAACVSATTDDPQGAAPTASSEASPGDARVKGERITRGDEEEETPAPTDAPTPAPSGSPEPAAPPATLPPPPSVVAAPTATAPPVDSAPVRVVRVVRIGVDDLEIDTLDSRPGDNTISFGWDEGAGAITGATSGVRLVGGVSSELLTDLGTESGSIVNVETLRNTAEDRRLHVDGRLVHEVFEDGRLVATLRSERLDVILAPGGLVEAEFSYLLPTGHYVVQASFESRA